ncbi:MAG: hypothetical protein AVO35_12025 [Candidatus Aegiribacteria sp. MLS_C]|nr:MAG: hypothetical protein AVO35_12025 [Candidatus Aegiribacteria sp. MLS_C]
MAGIYDLMEWPMERLLFRRLRCRAVEYAEGRTLEVGVGTGKNLEFYPSGMELSAIDFSPGMLEVAARKAEQPGMPLVELREMDLEDMDYADGSFSTVISTFVFCTVPHPMKGLMEIRRVLEPGGKAVFLEHMRSGNPILNIFLCAMSRFTRPILGDSMVRRTLSSIRNAGFEVSSVEDNLFGIVKLITAGRGPD